jgi:hypothetical protein
VENYPRVRPGSASIPEASISYRYRIILVSITSVTNLALASGLQGLRHVKLGAQLHITSQALFTSLLLSLVFFNIRRYISEL